MSFARDELDLVPLLHAEAADIRAHHPGIGYVATLYTLAADEITRLREALERDVRQPLGDDAVREAG